MPGVVRIGDKDSAGDTQVEGSSTVLVGDTPGSPSFSNVPITLPEEYDIEFATPVIKQAGRFAAFDDPESVKYTPEEYPEDTKPDDFDGTVKEDANVTDEEKATPELSDCRVIELPLNYSLKLSTNFTIADLSTGALFPHSIQAQKGLTEQDIVCNLEGLAKNILEPLRTEYGSFRINSGFRKGNGKSQHYKGQAVDIQEPTWTNQKHLDVAKWMAENLPVDQLIYEHGNSVWIHVSFNRSNITQRGQLLTMLNGNYESGLKLYY